MRNELGKIHAGVAGLLEYAAGAEHLGRLFGEGVHEGEALAFEEFFRSGFGIVLNEFGLVVEELELAGPTGLEEVDDVVDLCFVMPGCTMEILRGEADARVAEELAASAIE